MGRRKHSFRGLTALLLIALMAGVPAAGAQTQGDVDDAARDLTAARADLESARRDLAAADALRSLVGDDLAAAIHSYSAVTDDLQQLSFRVADLREQVIARESEIRQLREDAKRRVVKAYMTGTVTSIDALFGADSFAEAEIGNLLLERAAERNVTVLQRLAAVKEQTDDLREKYATEVDAAEIKQQQTNLMVAQLDALFQRTEDDVDAARSGVLEAGSSLSDADAEHRAAVRRFEEEIRRRAEALGVERWRTLVEFYFPPERRAEAFAVMRCESGGNPNATHPVSNAAGLYQFLLGTWIFSSRNAGFEGASRYNPEANIAAAAWLVQSSIDTNHPRGPWGHWSCRP